MNLFEGLPNNTEITFECIAKFGFTATYQALKGLPWQFQNDVLAMIPVVEASLNLAKRLKYIVVIDEQTGLAQGPFLKDKVKLGERK